MNLEVSFKWFMGLITTHSLLSTSNDTFGLVDIS